MEGVADAGAQAQHVIGMKLIVIEDVVKISLGAHKELPQKTIVNSRPGVNQEMITVQVSGTTRRIKALPLRIVENQGLAAKASGEQARKSTCEMGREGSIHVVEKRAVFLVVVIELALVDGGNLRTVAEMIPEDAVDGYARIDAALFGGRRVGLRGIEILGGEQDAGSGGKVKLLGMGEGAERNYCQDERKKRELSQYSPLVSLFRLLVWARQTGCCADATA